MDAYSPCYDQNPFGSNSQQLNPIDTLSPSSHSDEELILASSQPKKRAGRKKFNETRHPVYRGVRKKNSNRWVCELREPNKKTRIWLGTYATAEMAARAHDVAALALRGPQACLNFADSVWRLPVPTTKEAKDIQKAAMEAAEAFRPRDEVADEAATTSTGVSGGNEAAMEHHTSYMDEEAVYDMPGLIANMAEGMLLSPPCLAGSSDWDYEESNTDLSLWSYSM
ncbi:hypothetical protein LguiA_015591 [Lonicera macranthoides]